MAMHDHGWCLDFGPTYLRVEKVGVNYCPLDIIQVSEVFQGSLEKASFLTQLSNMGSVIVSEHLVS